MSKTYVHPVANDSIGPEGRCYWLEEELLEHKGKTVLCLHSRAGFSRFCDGSALSELYTIFVKGYVAPDKYRMPRGADVISEFQPISDERERREVSAALLEKWGTAQVYFD